MAEESRVRVPNLDTLADYIDRLIVEVHKLAWFENEKRKEQAKPSKDLALIAQLDDRSRDCCELRSMLKNRINELFADILKTGSYTSLREVRTFRPPSTRLSDALADRCHDIGTISLRGGIAVALSNELGGTGTTT